MNCLRAESNGEGEISELDLHSLLNKIYQNWFLCSSVGLIQWQNLYSAEWGGSMSTQEFGRKQLWPISRYYSGNRLETRKQWQTSFKVPGDSTEVQIWFFPRSDPVAPWELVVSANRIMQHALSMSHLGVSFGCPSLHSPLCTVMFALLNGTSEKYINWENTVKYV